MRPAGSTGPFTAHSTVHRSELAKASAPLVTTGGGGDGASLPHAPLPHAASVDATACVRPAWDGLRLRREVRVSGQEVALEWTVANGGGEAIELGGVALSMPFNQLFSGRTLPQVAQRCSFTDVYLGAGAGYVQAGGARLSNPPRPPRRFTLASTEAEAAAT